MKQSYKYMNWPSNTLITDILKELENQEGFDVISHAQSVHGMSVIMRRREKPIKNKIKKWILDNHEHHSSDCEEIVEEPYVDSLALEDFINKL